MPGRVKAEYVVEIVPIGEPIKVGNFLYALVETRFINNDYFRLWHGWVITTSVKFYVNSITYPLPKQDGLVLVIIVGEKAPEDRFNMKMLAFQNG